MVAVSVFSGAISVAVSSAGAVKVSVISVVVVSGEGVKVGVMFSSVASGEAVVPPSFGMPGVGVRSFCHEPVPSGTRPHERPRVAHV
jgi:hypothetical protein